MKISLARLTFLAWLAWLLTLGIIAGLSMARILHPNFLYMAIPLSVQVICTVAVFGGGIWRTIRGPERLRAAFWLWLGMLPTLWMAAYLEYLFHYASVRNHPWSLWVNSAEAVTSLLGEPYMRVCYPYQHEAKRFVMWSDSPEADRKQLAAMDEHLRAMEDSLGSRSAYKVHWVRGPVWGLGGRYGFGWALGSSPHEGGDETDGLNYMDRHEIAHFALEQLLPYGKDPPTLLREGWAEAHSGKTRLEAIRRSCYERFQNRQLTSLRDLTSPVWYHVADGPVYPQGGVLVDYLLRRFGYQKFLELYCSCGPDTFADDVQRVLGVSLDELDDDYQEDLLKPSKPEPTDKEYLLSMKLGEKVSPEKWRQFVDDYCAGVERLRAAYRQSSVKLASTTENVIDGDTGKEITTIDVTQYDNDSPRQAITWTSTMNGVTYTTLSVITPKLEFKLSKHTPENSWHLLEYKADNGRKRPLRACDRPDRHEYLWMPLRPLSGRFNGSNFETKITEIEADRQPLRVHFETTVQAAGTAFGRGWWDLDPEQNYVLIEEQWEDLAYDVSSRVTVQYESIAGNPVLKRIFPVRCRPFRVRNLLQLMLLAFVWQFFLGVYLGTAVGQRGWNLDVGGVE